MRVIDSIYKKNGMHFWKDCVVVKRLFAAPDYKRRTSVKYSFKDPIAWIKYEWSNIRPNDFDCAGDEYAFFVFDNGEAYVLEHCYWWDFDEIEGQLAQYEFCIEKIDRARLPEQMLIGDRDWI